MPFHALDHGIERALPFGSVLVVELVLHAASQQGVYQETAAAGHQPRSPARTAFEYALELVGVYEMPPWISASTLPLALIYAVVPSFTISPCAES